MRRIAYFFSILILGFSSLSSHAQTLISVSEFTLWSSTYGVDSVRVTVPVTDNQEGCTDPDSYFLASSLSAATKERIFAMLLAAMMANREIEFYLDGCEGNRPALQDVRLTTN